MEERLYIALYRYTLKPQFEIGFWERSFISQHLSFLRYDMFQQALEDYRGMGLVIESRNIEQEKLTLYQKTVLNDPLMKERGKELLFLHRKSKEFLESSIHSCNNEAEIHNYMCNLNHLLDFKNSQVDSLQERELTSSLPLSYLKWWIKRTFYERKRVVRKLYPKKEFPSANNLLNRMNSYLKVLASVSIHEKQSLQEYVKFGESIDWLFQLFTETNLTKESEFVQLFERCLRNEHDLVSLTGELNILSDPEAVVFLLEGKLPYSEKYLSDFSKVLETGIRIGKIIEKTQLATIHLKENREQNENCFLAMNEERKKKEKLKELESYHNIGVDYKKIHEIENFK